MHFDGIEIQSDKLVKLTEKTVCTLKQYKDRWVVTEKQPERNICSLAPNLTTECYIHRSCYSKLTCKPKVEVAERLLVSQSKRVSTHNINAVVAS